MEESNHGDRKSGSSYWRHRYYPHYWWRRRYYPYHRYYDNYPYDDYYSWRRRYGSQDTTNNNGYNNNSNGNNMNTNLNFMNMLHELFSLKVDAMTMIKLLQYSRDKQLSDEKIFEIVEDMLEKYHSSGEMLEIDDIEHFEKEAEVRAKQANEQYHPWPGPMPTPEPTPSPEPVVSPPPSPTGT